MTDELEVGAYVLHEQRHVVGEVKLGRGEYERVSEDGGATQAIHLEIVKRHLLTQYNFCSGLGVVVARGKDSCLFQGVRSGCS